MIKIDLYNQNGKKERAVNLPKSYDIKPNLELLSQAVHVYEDRAHFGLAYAKTRSEVAISRKKIYRQKGTGGARHGAKSAPIFVGGGVTHGPKGVKRTLRLSHAQKSKALMYAVNLKVSRGKAVLISGINKINKTKEAAKQITEIIKEKNWKSDNILVALSQKNEKTEKFFRNIGGITTEIFGNLNAYEVYRSSALMIDGDVFDDVRETAIDTGRYSDKKHNKSGKKFVGKSKKEDSKQKTKSESKPGKKMKVSKKRE